MYQGDQREEIFGFHKKGNLPAEKQLVWQEGLCSMDVVDEEFTKLQLEEIVKNQFYEIQILTINFSRVEHFNV
jgi:hypothetical protein